MKPDADLLDALGYPLGATIVRALLAAEWRTMGGPTYACPACTPSWTFNRRHQEIQRWTEDHKPRHLPCPIDAALTALGFPDAESRDLKRSELRHEDRGY